MCEHKKYKKTSDTRIDNCMTHLVSFINLHTQFKTVACCCGHNKYNSTLIIKGKVLPTVWEIFSGTPIIYKRKYYKRDTQGYYFIPEVTDEK